MLTNPNVNGAKDVLAKYGISTDMVVNKMAMYNKCMELDANE
jgi:hypothetical protein